MEFVRSAANSLFLCWNPRLSFDSFIAKLQSWLEMATPDKNPFVLIARYSEIGFIIPACVLLGYILGWGLDHFLHTHWIYVVGLVFGAIVGFVQMIRMAVAYTREKND